MSYRLIDANDLNGKISAEDYEVVLKEPCIYADLPNGMDGKGYEVISWENIPKDATNGDVIKAMFPKIEMFVGSNVVETNYHAHGDIWFCTAYDKEWWNTKYKWGVR